MPPEFRLCAPQLKGRPQQTILRSNGAFYTQGFEEADTVTAEGGRCWQAAFFHMQEWKKRPEFQVDPTAAYDTFRLSQDGIHEIRLK